MTKVSIITVNYNQAQVTAELLESLKGISYKDLEVIVVDNASKEDPTALLKSVYPTVTVVRSNNNLGFAGGNNLGIQASRGDYLFFINNDAEVTEGAIESMLYLFHKVPKLGVVSPKLYYHLPERKQPLIQYAGSTEVNTLTGRNKTIGLQEDENGQYGSPYPTAYAHGAAMMIPRSVVREVGMMPEEFFLYYEELDWCTQIKRAGYKIYVEPRAVIYHKESISVGRLSLLKTYYINRNRILFMRRNKSEKAFMLFSIYLWLVSVPKNLAQYLLRGEFQHARTYIRAVGWNYGFKSRPKDARPSLAAG